MYSVENHSKAIYKIVSARSQQRGTIFLDLASEDHYHCISEMFGGEESFKKDFPKHYSLAQEARKGQAAKQLIIAGPDQQGFNNYAAVEDISYKKPEKQLYSCGYTNLVEKSDAIYQTLFVYRNGTRIDQTTAFTYNSNFASIDLISNNIEPLGGQKDDLLVVVHSSWKPKGKDTFLSAISYDGKDSRATTLDEVVKSIDVSDPRHINTSPDSNIMVTYGRTPSGGESVDYSYPEVRVERQQKVYLANSGTVTLQDNVKFIGGDVKTTSIVLNHETLGTIWYSTQIPDSAIVKVDDTHFTWNINDDWNQVIPGSIEAGTRVYAYDMHLSFFAVRPSDPSPKQFFINICSYQKPPNPHYKQISFIKFLWGCLAEDTLVRMGDGSTKTIQTVAIGDKVMGQKGNLLNVTNVWTGPEKGLLKVITKNGNEIMATEKHPFMTKKGMRPLLSLYIGDELLMEDNKYSAIAQCYPVSYGRTVYNLDVDGDHAFICNGFVVGGNMVQNSCETPKTEAAAQPELLSEAEKLKLMHSKTK